MTDNKKVKKNSANKDRLKTSLEGRLEGLHSFRFRRWSRAGYAVFRSLSLCVTIGKISYDICTKAFEKLKGAIQKMFAFVSSENDVADENSEHDEQFFKHYQLEQILINYTSNSSVATSVVVVVFLLLSSGWNRNFLFQPLFL